MHCFVAGLVLAGICRCLVLVGYLCFLLLVRFDALFARFVIWMVVCCSLVVVVFGVCFEFGVLLVVSVGFGLGVYVVGAA